MLENLYWAARRRIIDWRENRRARRESVSLREDVNKILSGIEPTDVDFSELTSKMGQFPGMPLDDPRSIKGPVDVYKIDWPCPPVRPNDVYPPITPEQIREWYIDGESGSYLIGEKEGDRCGVEGCTGVLVDCIVDVKCYGGHPDEIYGVACDMCERVASRQDEDW